MPLRINGFSGMDVDSMVKQLMTAKRVPLDKLNQQKTYLSWQRDSYREMNSKVFGFKTKLSDVFGKASAMTAQTAVVSGNTDAIKAEAAANASTIPMSVRVMELAAKTSLQPKGSMYAKPATENGDAPTAKLSTTLGDLNNYEPATSPVPSDENPETFQLTINKVELNFSSKDSISTILSKINNSTANVLASFDEISGRFSFSAKDYGSENKIFITESNYSSKQPPETKKVKMLELLNVDPTDESSRTPAKEAVIKVSTKFDSNGNPIDEKEFKSNKNTLTVNGITMTLLAESVDKPSTIKTTIDPTKAVDTMKSFVQSYNELIDLMNTKVGEEKYRDFTPLSDEQKSAMKENDITAWEAKAKSGLLKNDDILKDAINSMRSIINSNMGQLSSMGITTGSYYEGGKLILDEGKMKDALQSNPQQITDLFQGSTGIISKLSTTMTSTLQKFSDRAGTNRFSGDLNSTFKEESVMGKQMKDYTSQITAMLKRLEDAEDRYYKQFTAMETAMSKLQSQSSSLFGNSSQ
ncbi:flagellar filament capping protein FliD [Paenibacillus dokdonensis]|uniref:Flagellar hook-associated protein 2 n=1 Tax=Paenibacillus dokdonensis TaxID=2567944 RepID=A0ABU6GT15_9BACL|nr:flagellar filament capping protein FliD [Paenibacillus dokdonensis]MEC0241421.1 flagellar filament capping protein FliD [Paenibacillus dokdonensis]